MLSASFPVSRTVSGGSGNLSSGGNVFSPSVWLCVSRQPHPSGPLTDLSLLYLDRGEEGGRLAPGYELVPGDLNHGSYGYCIALCTSRSRLSSSHAGPILDVAVVNHTAHDSLPPRYAFVGPPQRRNVNAGSFRDQVHLACRRAVKDPLAVRYKPAVVDRFPRTELRGSPLPASIALVRSLRCGRVLRPHLD